MPDYPIDLLEEMLTTYSPSGSEEKLAELLVRHMMRAGFKVRRDKAGNVIGEAGNEGPRILFCGHMDTVPGELPVRNDSVFLHGRGAVDAKSTLAAMLLGGELAVKQALPPFRLIMVGAVEEETTGTGIKALINEEHTYDFAVFGEPSGANNIIIGYKGQLTLQATIRTSGGHSAAPWISKNSVEESLEFWNALKESMLKNDSPEKFSNLTGCITSAHGGEIENNIPSQAIINMDIRLPPQHKPEQVAAKIATFVSTYVAAHEDVTINLENKEQCPAYLGDSSSSAVHAFRWAIKNNLGGPVQLLKKTGTSDMNVFAQKYHIPMIAYGPGNSALDHTEHEKVRKDEYLSSIQVYASAIKKFIQLHQDNTHTAHISR